MVEYWKMHFKYEEDLMQQYEYSGFDEHKKEHDRIMGDFSNYEEMLFLKEDLNILFHA